MTNPIDPAEIPVVLLAGGMGMRLHEETVRVPKPMVEIGGRPILWHIMKVFAEHGHRRFVVCLGYRGWIIKEWFTNYHHQLADIRVELASSAPPVVIGDTNHEDWEVTLAETGLHTGTVGRLAAVAKYLDAPYFMLTYGDSIGDVDVTAVRARHEASGQLATMTGVKPLNRFGVLTTTPEGSVTAFSEKPEISEGHANGGFMAMDRAVLDRVVGADPQGFVETDLLPPLVQAGQVGMHGHDGFWMGMDTMRDVSALEDLWESGKAPWKTWSD